MTEILPRIDALVSTPQGSACVGPGCDAPLGAGWPSDWCSETCQQAWSIAHRGVRPLPQARLEVRADPGDAGPATLTVQLVRRPPAEAAAYIREKGPERGLDPEVVEVLARHAEVNAARVADLDDRALIAEATSDELADALREVGYAVTPPSWWQRFQTWPIRWMPRRWFR